MSFDLERELKRALHREDASHNFTDRVMARIASGGAKRKPARSENGWWERVRSFFQPAAVKWAMAGAAVFLFIFAAVCVHRYREQQRAAVEIAEGERAKEQVMLAMKIASAKLNLAQKKVTGSR
jgi:hypothetical protein